MSIYKHQVVSEDVNGVGTETTLGIGVIGAGGSVTQLTDKSTAVTLNSQIGKITLNGAALAAATIGSFTFTNSNIVGTSNVRFEHVSGGTAGAYTVANFPGAGSTVVSVRNNTAGSLSEAIVLRFEITPSSDS